MKKVLFLALCLTLAIGAVYAKPMQPDNALNALEISGSTRIMPQTRNAPAYEFTKTPTVLLESYYDYMIGSYNSLPIRVIPNDDGGYFMTYHGRRQASGSRRVFYVHLDAAGNVVNQNEITLTTNHEGYPSLGVDPVSAKPMYAWHANADGDIDPDFLEVEFTSDAFMFGLSGLFNEVEMIIDNPIDITLDGGVVVPGGEFIWPTIQIGPSPTDGMRRVYVSSRNATTNVNTGNPAENVYITYADFNGAMIEAGTSLDWNYTTIPTLNQWNNDLETRRPSNGITVDHLGNVYYIGYHIAWDADDETIVEPEADVFINTNYGEGEWRYITDYTGLPTWNPDGTQGSGQGYFVGDGDIAYADEELEWGILNSGHLNAVTDNQGRVIFPAIFGITVSASGSYYPAFQTVKSVVFDPATEEFEVVEIYPQKDPNDDFNAAFTPWDIEAPWGEPEYPVDGGDGNFYMSPFTIWPFPHWDDSLHDSLMMFHCSNMKLSEPNEDGLMVAVWQDAMRAKDYNEYPDSYPELAPFADTPEIYIAVSSDSGDSWSEPIILNKVETTPEFTDIKPMWVYPADKVITTGQETGPDGEVILIGKIGLMFYDDYTWGANAISPPAHSVNDGGAVMFTELQISFGPSSSNDNPTAPVVTRILNQNYPNPFNPETTISFDMPVAGNAKLDIYNVKGQLVKTLFNGAAPSGRTSLVWDSTDSNDNLVTSGLYFYRLSTDKHSETRKMMLMK